MTTEQLDAAVRALSWYHKIELPGGIVTPGWAPARVELYKFPESCEGMRVLDVGAWDGYWTFEALKRGAREVVAIDDLSDPLDFNKGLDSVEQGHTWANFDLCKAALGYEDGRCGRRTLSVYDLCPENVGTFDLVLAYGLLYHLRHPLLGLDKMAGVSTGEIRIESAILDDYSPYRGGLGRGYPHDEVVMEFYPENQYGMLQTNWWVPTLQCLGQMVRAAGWEVGQAWKVTTPRHVSECRGFVTGTRHKSSMCFGMGVE